MNEIIIDITDILSPDLKSRSTVSDLKAYIENLNADIIKIDFANVLFATRSFIDEYYNLFISNNSGFNSKEVKTINIPEDIQHIFNAVSQTQFGEKKDSTPRGTVLSFTSIKELNAYLVSLML